MGESERVLNKIETARALGISLPTLDKWIHLGLPYLRRGSKGTNWEFDLLQCLEWRDLMQSTSSQRWGGGNGSDDMPASNQSVYNQARRFRQSYLGRLVRLEYEMKSQQFVPAENVRLEAHDLGQRLHAALDGLPDRIARQVRMAGSDFDAREILREAFLSALSDLAIQKPSNHL